MGMKNHEQVPGQLVANLAKVDYFDFMINRLFSIDLIIRCAASASRAVCVTSCSTSYSPMNGERAVRLLIIFDRNTS